VRCMDSSLHPLGTGNTGRPLGYMSVSSRRSYSGECMDCIPRCLEARDTVACSGVQLLTAWAYSSSDGVMAVDRENSDETRNYLDSQSD
jgi:hypothetical protein